MDVQTRNALVMDNYGYWVWVVQYLSSTRPHLRRVDRDELVQDAVCQLLSVAGNWDGVRPFKNFGYSVILFHLCNRYFSDRLIKLQRRVRPGLAADHRRRELLDMNLGGEEALALREAPPSPDAREAEGRELREVVDTLPPYLAERIKDRYGLGRPAMLLREMGEQGGCSMKAAGGRVDTAMEHLRRAVAA